MSFSSLLGFYHYKKWVSSRYFPFFSPIHLLLIFKCSKTFVLSGQLGEALDNREKGPVVSQDLGKAFDTIKRKGKETNFI